MRARRRSVPHVPNVLAPLSNVAAKYTHGGHGKTSRTANVDGGDLGAIDRAVRRREQLIRHLSFTVGGERMWFLTLIITLDQFSHPILADSRFQRGTWNSNGQAKTAMKA